MTELAFSCDVPHEDPATPGFVTSTQAAALQALPRTDPRWIRSLKTFSREFRTLDLRMPDGREFELWVFADDAVGPQFPSQVIRVTEGDLVQVRMKARKNVHTIHHHGIEPDAFNDGVGHTSFEAGEYTYQWRAGEAGSYFYHCHVNTVLHVQMGLLGALTVDPDPTVDPPVPTGYRRLFRGGPVYKIANERTWAIYSLDPRMHNLDHAAGLCGEDVGLNRFDPRYFLINNKAQTNGFVSPAEFAKTQPPPSRPPIVDPKIAITAKKGETVLIRTIQAQYFPVTIVFGGDAELPGPPLSAQIWGSDGRPFRRTFSYKGDNETGTPVSVDNIVRFDMSPAERWDFLLNTPTTALDPGVYPIRLFYNHWITDDRVGEVRTQLTITP
jgi:FtsP/CotA-like multicopper oxidase with cupredoxin domain